VYPYLWVAVVGTLVLSGFFALTNNALRMFRRAQLEEVFSVPEGQRKLKILEAHLTEFRLVSSLCRSLANLLLVVLFMALLGAPSSVGWGRIFAALASAGGVVAVFGVAIPHAWAAYRGEYILLSTYRVLMVVRLVLYPVVMVMHALDLPIRRLAGKVDEEGELSEVAKLEILQAASDAQAERAMDREEVEMIESVMEFGETHAGEIMTPRTDIFALPVDVPVREAIERVMNAGHSRVPVYDGDLDNIVGILYAKDLLRNTVSEGEVPLRELLRKPFFVPETKRLDDLLREFKTRKFHISVVLDEYGGTAGLVTIEDVLEEIVGEIADEYDPSAPELMTRAEDGSAVVEGRLRVDELNHAVGLDLPDDEDYDTVAGFLFSEMGYIPSEGETLESHGARFTVLSASDRKIDRIRVEVLQPQEQTEQL
jgi:CBS domain containing-hemolysin-like protein